MYDGVAYLMQANTPTYDSEGNEIITYTERMVYVMPRSVYSSEFYAAAEAGLHPSITFELTNRADYANERLIKWNGQIYNVIRTDWVGQRDAIRLICEERIHNG